MSIWFLIKMFFLFLYIGLSALITFIIYNEQKDFYTPIYVTKKPSKEGEKEETVNIHDEFDEYTKRDEPVNFLRLFLGVLTIFWFKFLLDVGLIIYFNFKMMKINKAKNFKLTKEDIDYIIKKTKFLTKIFIYGAGIFVDYKRLPDEVVLPVYKKYFGPDYKLDYNGKFCCYIANHTCLLDMALAMAYLGCGFVAKEAVKKTPLFGTLNVVLHTIFVDRGSTGAKKDVLEEIGERQKDYYEGKSVMPFLIFPEGTTTSGRHILTFKKGAFNSLLPIKPTFIHPNMGKKFHIGCGASHAGFSYLRALCQLYNKVEYVELPILTPNEYMFTNFSSYGKEKWEIYAEVSREIMCTLGNFKKSNMGIKDSFRYISCIKEKALLDRSTYKIKDE